MQLELELELRLLASLTEPCLDLRKAQDSPCLPLPMHSGTLYEEQSCS